MAVVSNDAYKDILEDLSVNFRPSSLNVECIIHLPELKLKPHKVVGIDLEMDFYKAAGDDGVLELSMTAGDYQRYVLPNLDNLIVEIVYSYVGNTPGSTIDGIPPYITKYRAYARQTSDMDLQGTAGTDLDQTLGKYTFDITSRTVEYVRMTSVGGIYRDARPIDILRVLYHEISKDAGLPQDEATQGTDYVPPAVEGLQDFIIIPDGTPLIDLPTYLNEHCGGIYNQGIGCYYHANIWFIYPALNTSRYQESKHTLDIYVAPPNHMPGYDRTYMKRHNKLIVLSTGDYKQMDKRDEDLLNQGSGVRFSKSTPTFENWAKTKKNVAVAQPNETMAQFVVKERGSNMSQIRNAPSKFTDNVAHQLSLLQPRVGYYILFTWENARPDLLVPGMGVTFNYMSEDKVTTLYASITNVEILTTTVTGRMTDDTYVTNCAITLFVADGATRIV